MKRGKVDVKARIKNKPGQKKGRKKKTTKKKVAMPLLKKKVSKGKNLTKKRIMSKKDSKIFPQKKSKSKKPSLKKKLAKKVKQRKKLIEPFCQKLCQPTINIFRTIGEKEARWQESRKEKRRKRELKKQEKIKEQEKPEIHKEQPEEDFSSLVSQVMGDPPAKAELNVDGETIQTKELVTVEELPEENKKAIKAFISMFGDKTFSTNLPPIELVEDEEKIRKALVFLFGSQPETKQKQLRSLFKKILRGKVNIIIKKESPKVEKEKNDPYAGKWIEIRMPGQKRIAPLKEELILTPKRQTSKITQGLPETIKVINKPKIDPEVKKMTETELREKFPGAFS